MATMRLRLTAHSLAGLHAPASARNGTPDPVQERLHNRAIDLTSFYDQIAVQVGHVPRAPGPRAPGPRAAWPPRPACRR